MAEYLIQDNTLVDIACAIREKSLGAEVILEKTSYSVDDYVTWDYDNGFSEHCLALINDGPIINTWTSTSTYQVTINGTHYYCQPWGNWGGESCLGNSQLIWCPDHDICNDHPEDVPFCIIAYYYNNDIGGGLVEELVEWGEWCLFTAEPMDCTVEIKRFEGDIPSIQVKDYSNEIRAIGVHPFKDTIQVTMNITVDSRTNLDVFGYRFKGRSVEYFKDNYPSGTNTTVIYNIIADTSLVFYSNNSTSDWLRSTYCNVTGGWCGYQAGSEQYVVPVPAIDPGAGYCYPITLNIDSSLE